MAKKHNSALELSEIQEALLQIAARRAAESDALGAEVLRLAAALSNAAALDRQSGAVPNREDALAGWRDACAELLAALAPALDGGHVNLAENARSTRDDSLPARAMELASQSRNATEALTKASQVLREQVAALLREASRHGALERELQLKRAELADHAARAKANEVALGALDSEKGFILARIEDLQQRFRIASRTPEEIARLEEEVKSAEARHRDLAEKLRNLEGTLNDLEIQKRALPERIEKTEALIRDLRESAEHELIGQINEIWKRLKRFHEGRE